MQQTVTFYMILNKDLAWRAQVQLLFQMLYFLHVFDIANPENCGHSFIDAFKIINEWFITINTINEQLKHKTKFVEEACYVVAG